ncbi:MAG: hypothetical protein OHK0053_08310 [Microscillaceae bacterium]
MKIALFLNFLIEGLVGLVFVIDPTLVPVLAPGDALTMYLARMYGFAALSVTFLSLRAWLHYHEQSLLENTLFTLALFHTGIALAQFINELPTKDQIPPGVLHIVLALVFWVGYIRER